MKVMIAGADGYLGYPLTQHLLARGHEVIGVDNLSRRKMLRQLNSWTAVPIGNPYKRFQALNASHPGAFDWRIVDLKDGDEVEYLFELYKPDSIVHLGENPSAPYSQISRKHCNETMINNIIGTTNLIFAMAKHTPDAHMVKLGTMGEYKIPPDGRIPEAAPSEYPRQPGSFYHATKVADSVNIEHAVKCYGISSTDIMQGVVYGVVTDEMKYQQEGLEDTYDPTRMTRFDFDEYFGTVINRFCAQALIDLPLTVYGAGGQTRGYIALRDSIQAMRIAVENPADKGEYRVWNQFDEVYSVNELAMKIIEIGQEMGLDPKVYEDVHGERLYNPRVEAERHLYKPDRERLPALGFKATQSIEDEIRLTMSILTNYKKRIEAKKESIMPHHDFRRPEQTDIS